MRKLIALLLGLLFLVSSVPAAAAADLSFLQPAAAAPLRITLISTNGTPLPDAEIQVLTPGLPGITAARTDQRGQATIALPPGHTFWIRAWADGHALTERAYVPASDGPALTLTAEPYTAVITGVVRDERGLPVPQATIQLFRAGYGLEATARTNDLGVYSLSTARAGGEYTLQAHADRHRPVSQEMGGLDPRRRNQVDLTLPSALARITGEVVSGVNGAPVSDATVELLLADWGPVASVRTDRSGYFSLSAPPAEGGVYQLRLSRYDHETITTGTFTLEDGGWIDFSGADRLVLNRLYAVVAGRVFDGNAEPLKKVEVHLQRAGLGTVQVARTDEEGRFSFSEVTGGTYRVRAFPGGTLVRADSGWLEVAGGQTVSANIVASSPDTYGHGLAILSGTVKNHLDEPVAGAVVRVNRGSQNWTARTDEEGRYDLSLQANIPDDPTGSRSTGYHVSVQVDGYLYTDQPVTDGENPPSLVDVRRGSNNTADFVLQPERATIAGRVVDDRGEPLAGVKVGLREEGRSKIAETETDAAGRYQFANLPVARQSRYLPVILDPGYVGGSVAPDGTQREPQVLTPAGPNHLVLVARPAETRFLGLVQAGDDRPAEGAEVTVLRSSDGSAFTGAVGADGSYDVRVPAMPGEAYLVRVAGENAALNAAAEVVRPGTGFGVQANLTTHVHASIVGRVVGPDGSPLSGIRVVLYTEGQSAADRVAFTDNEGIYRFNHLVPGRRYAPVAVDSSGVRSATAPGEVVITPLVGLPSGETVWADIRLDVPAAP
ncbi:protocatechuate 3,4-dioxygenase beta subunit [Symbiobacterium terraclitae]|uniref:Protocatechuate 3,4-dioxygenase beta subunit n=1 Tax=Symbiobacterium terraclitae TaxID=557451 RepID=A0ABS4JV45_9FIRM|nr:carboxypeptidase-like regulatory domain-containing protein [Symbiobacterium terraclitae]MBP2019385.1 protocatechuate 3,4-dioxygenase beta subunit [Symbiobacterium terraclitae]